MEETEETALKTYEIGYLARGEEGASVLASHLTQIGATILFGSDLRNIKLTYPIQHLSSAYFGYVHFEALPDLISNLDAALKLDSQIIRFLVITPPVMRERSGSSTEPREIREVARPKVEPGKEIPVSNDLLEEKLEEILNK